MKMLVFGFMMSLGWYFAKALLISANETFDAFIERRKYRAR